MGKIEDSVSGVARSITGGKIGKSLKTISKGNIGLSKIDKKISKLYNKTSKSLIKNSNKTNTKFGADSKGNPTVETTYDPSNRKQTKSMAKEFSKAHKTFKKINKLSSKKGNKK